MHEELWTPKISGKLLILLLLATTALLIPACNCITGYFDNPSTVPLVSRHALAQYYQAKLDAFIIVNEHDGLSDKGLEQLE